MNKYFIEIQKEYRIKNFMRNPLQPDLLYYFSFFFSDLMVEHICTHLFILTIQCLLLDIECQSGFWQAEVVEPVLLHALERFQQSTQTRLFIQNTLMHHLLPCVFISRAVISEKSLKRVQIRNIFEEECLSVVFLTSYICKKNYEIFYLQKDHTTLTLIKKIQKSKNARSSR